MTEYELLDVMETVNGNSITATGVYFSILTAYLLVAYVAGLKLTRYQVAFINVIFILYNIIAALNLAMMIRVRLILSQRLIEMSGEARMFSDETGAVVIAVFILMRAMLVLGALIFMWQVRRPQTE